MYLRLAALGSVIGIFLATCEVHALGIAYTTVDYPGGNFTEVTGVQGNEMVGTYGSYPFMRGFVSIGGSFAPLDVPSSLGSETTPRGISASGVIAGYYTTAANVSQGFLYDGTKFMTLTNPGAGTSSGQGTQAFGVDGSRVVGGFIDSDSIQQGFLFDGTTYKTIVPGPHLDASVAAGISGNTIVGAYADGSDILHGMIYDGTNYSTLDNPLGGHSAGDGTELYGIDNGIIVGTYYNSNKAPHGFYYTGGIFTPVDFPGSINTQVLGISGDVIVGTYEATDQTGHGFMAVIPEPPSIVLFGFALLGLLIAARPWLRITLANRQHDSRCSGLASGSPATVSAGAPRSCSG